MFAFNPQADEPAKDYDVQLLESDGNKKWTGHPSEKIDVGVISINPIFLKDRKMKFNYFRSDMQILSISKMLELGTTEGDFVYVLGYPMGIVDPDRQYVIARSGSIARIRDVLEQRSNEIILDVFIFPGNSGGPVISKPEILSISGTTASRTSYLIGIVKGYIPYQDIAISKQTKRPRIIFEENSGLSTVIPADFIMETIELDIGKKGIK